MTALGRSLDLVLWGLGAAAWGMTVFVLSSRFIDDTLGGLLGLATATSAMAYVLGSHLRDDRVTMLSRGTCPSCKGPIQMEHRHRHWDPGTSSWAAPSTAWECPACSFSHAENWACPECEAQA